MERQYELDLANSTEIILSERCRIRLQQPRQRNASVRQGGSSSRAAAGALRLANTMGAAITDRRVLGPAESVSLGGGGLVLAAIVIAAILPTSRLALAKFCSGCGNPAGALLVVASQHATLRHAALPHQE